MPFLMAVALTVVVASGTQAVAQTLDRAEIAGTVRDETGAALDGVTVTLRETRTGFERTTVTGRDGRYSAPLMPLGVYVVEAERPGFSAATSEPLALTVGQALVVDLVMRLAGLSETVSVSAAGDTAPALGTAIDAAALSSLPINGRDYRDFALLAPTARSITGTRGTFRVAGQPGDYLALNVDGADFTNSFFGEFFGSIERQNFTIPLEAVQEFEVSAGGLGAQAGRSNGGLVNVVTKSGSNQRHGSLAYFLRHHALTADDAFGNPPVGLVRHIAGGSVGGPFVADRTFYFGAADVQRQTTPITVKFARPVAGVAVPELGIADLGALEGPVPASRERHGHARKVDHMLTRRHRLSVRGSFSRSDGNNIAGGAALLSQAPSNLETFRNQALSIVASLSASAGTRLFLETKFQTSRETRPRIPQSGGPQVQISDTGTFGSALFLPSTQDMYRYQVSENAAYVRGKHDLKFGADYNAFNMRNNAFALGLNGAYIFPTLEAFVARRPLLYAQNFGLNGYTAQEAALLESFWQHEAAVYVQDRFRPTSRLTIGLGLRYDMQVNPQPQAGIAGVKVPVGPPVVVGQRGPAHVCAGPSGNSARPQQLGTANRHRVPASGRRLDDGEGLGWAVLRADPDDLLSAARRRRQQHDAVRAGLALRRHVPGGAAVGDRARLGPGDARRPAGHLVCGSRVRQSARASAQRRSDEARRRHVVRGRLHLQPVPEPSHWRISIHVVGPQPGAADAVRSSSAAGSTSSRPDARIPRLRRRTRSPASVAAAIRRCWSRSTSRWRTGGSSTPATRSRRAWATARPSATRKRCSGRRIPSIPAPTTASTSWTSGTSSSRTSWSRCP